MLVLTVGPSHAASYWDRLYPHVAHKLPDTHGSETVVVVQARAGNAWGVRPIVRTYSDRVPGLTMVMGRCADRPRAHCLRVNAGDFGGTGWWGLMTPWSRVQLNNRYGVHQMVACHEIGHALGLTHHKRLAGCLRDGSLAAWPSPAEIRALRRAYG